MEKMNKWFDLFYQATEDILTNPLFESQVHYVHHGDVSIYEHVIAVSYRSFVVASKLKRDAVSTARGALLHDFFLYDWHVEGKKQRKSLFKKHGFTHAKAALKNATTHFTLNRKEQDIILKHMFPLNLVPPRYFESWIVNLTDTAVTLKEVFRRKRHEKLMTFIQKKKVHD